KHLPKKSCMNNKSSSQGQHYSILVNNENSMNATIRLFAKSGKKEEFTVPSKDIISYSTCMVNQKLTIFAKKGGDDSSSSFKRVSTVRARPGGQKSFRIKAEVKPISATP
ncbi:MAG: hypothetical protein KAR54_01000, partial [Candidatus Pacebacteria bacterium]|nr:hypothetical protein [Candidatus Paceibacterota bacterium]